MDDARNHAEQRPIMTLPAIAEKEGGEQDNDENRA